MAREREDTPDLAQMRAELTLLRDELRLRTDKETAEKAAYASFLEWVALSAVEKTQRAADKRFAGMEGEIYEVELKEQPLVRLPAHSDYEAIGRYNEICGILGTEHTHTVTRLATAAA